MTAVSPKPPARKPTRRSRDDDERLGVRGRINQLANSKWGRRVVLPLGFLALGYVLFDQFSGPDVAGAVARGKSAGYPVSHKVSAEEYHGAVARNAKEASAKYHEDVYVEVSGKVRKVLADPKRISFLLETSSPTQAIECEFLARDEIEGLKPGDPVLVQGEARTPGKGAEKENLRPHCASCGSRRSYARPRWRYGAAGMSRSSQAASRSAST